MNDFIVYPLIDVDAEDGAIVAAVEMDAKDRHVLTEAISADAIARFAGPAGNEQSGP